MQQTWILTYKIENSPYTKIERSFRSFSQQSAPDFTVRVQNTVKQK